MTRHSGLAMSPPHPWSVSRPEWHSTHFDQISSSSSPDKMATHSNLPSIPLIIVYIVGFVITAFIIFGHAHDRETKTMKCDQPWVPGITRRDACAMPFFPVFFLLPAILWPLVLAGWILVLIASGLWMTLGSATSCCGIPLPHSRKQAEGDGGDGGAPRDLEMGAVESEGATGGVDDDSDLASGHSAASTNSEGPPSYASLEAREDGDGETDGLLGQSTK